MNKHTIYDLKQMQSLPLEAKIRMTKQRIQVWYESWIRYEIHNKKTGKVRIVTSTEEPALKENEYIASEYDGQVYVSFSGGKDSTVLKHIVDSMYSDVPSVFVNTGLEYPEIQTFVRDIKKGKYDCFNSNVEIVRPEMRFDEVIEKYGYPVVSKVVAQVIEEVQKNMKQGKLYTQRMQQLNGEFKDKKGNKSQFNYEKWKFLLDAPFQTSNKCCDVMKKKPSKIYEKQSGGRKPIVATMASEGRQRKMTWIQYGCNAFDNKRPKSQPMSFWTEQDVLQYIKKYNVPYASVYGDIVPQNEQSTIEEFLGVPEDIQLKTTGCDRTGCIFCMFGCHLEKGENRFQRLKKTHPRQYEYCIKGGEMVDGKWQPNEEGLGLGKVLDYIGVDYE